MSRDRLLSATRGNPSLPARFFHWLGCGLVASIFIFQAGCEKKNALAIAPPIPPKATPVPVIPRETADELLTKPTMPHMSSGEFMQPHAVPVREVLITNADEVALPLPPKRPNAAPLDAEAGLDTERRPLVPGNRLPEVTPVRPIPGAVQPRRPSENALVTATIPTALTGQTQRSMPPQPVPDVAFVPNPETGIPKAKPVVRAETLNELVLAAINDFPNGGSYAAGAGALEKLRNAVSLHEGSLQVFSENARPSFCSSATYLVFLSVAERLQREGRIHLAAGALRSLLVAQQKDGEGVWGRWNANGPGTARLFHELGLGRNFSSLQDARPGDFLKIWWTDEIGARERGHSVVFLGVAESQDGETYLKYWSSNKPKGYGVASIPLSKAKRMLFSRLENPRCLSAASDIAPRDSYLADMLKRSTSDDEMCEKVGIKLSPRSAPLSSTAGDRFIRNDGAAPRKSGENGVSVSEKKGERRSDTRQ